MNDEMLKPIHDSLHEFAKVLKEWAETFIKRAEELHTYDGTQRKVDEFG